MVRVGVSAASRQDVVGGISSSTMGAGSDRRGIIMPGVGAFRGDLSSATAPLQSSTELTTRL